MPPRPLRTLGRSHACDVTLVQRDALWRRWRTRPATAGGTLHAGIGVVAFSHGLASLQVRSCLSRWSCWITTYSGQEHQFSSKRVFCEFFALFYSFYTCRRRRLAVLVLGLLAGAVVVCLRERSVDVTLVQRDALWRRWRTRPATAGGTLHAGIGVVAFSHGLASLQVRSCLSRWSCWITTYSGQEHQFSSKRVFCSFL